MSVMIGPGGKVLLGPGGKVAIDSECCCICAYTISFEFKIDSSEYVSGNYGGELLDEIYVQPFYGATDVTLYVWNGSIDVPVGDFFDVWHTLVITITEKLDETGFDLSATLNGVDVPGAGSPSLSYSGVITNKLRFGSIFPDNNSHRSLKNIAVQWANQSFNFPPDSFDSLHGGASIVSGELRIDDNTAASGYGQKDLDRDLAYCCARDVTEINSITVGISFSASVDDVVCGTWSVSQSGSRTWTRIPKDQAFTTGQFEFKLYLRAPINVFETGGLTRCVAVLEFGSMGTLSLASGFSVLGDPCEADPDACGIGQSRVTGVTWSAEFFHVPQISISFNSTNFTASVATNGGGRARMECACADGTNNAGGVCDFITCEADPSQGSISWSENDLTGISGVYSASNTCDSMSATTTLSIA